MNIVKLTLDHAPAAEHLFNNEKYMGVEVNNATWGTTTHYFAQLTYNRFINAYLADLKNFGAYGAVDDAGIVQAFVCYYTSVDEPSWFYTLARSSGDNRLLKDVLDVIIDMQEKQGRMKVYSLVNLEHAKILRRLYWSKFNSDRYHYVDEYIVPAKYKTYYNRDWELLFKRSLLPSDSIVRCSFLKQEFRTVIPIGGSI
jgi:hypothetical protein